MYLNSGRRKYAVMSQMHCALPTMYKFFCFKIKIKTKADLYMPCRAMAHSTKSQTQAWKENTTIHQTERQDNRTGNTGIRIVYGEYSMLEPDNHLSSPWRNDGPVHPLLLSRTLSFRCWHPLFHIAKGWSNGSRGTVRPHDRPKGILASMSDDKYFYGIDNMVKYYLATEDSMDSKSDISVHKGILKCMRGSMTFQYRSLIHIQIRWACSARYICHLMDSMWNQTSGQGTTRETSFLGNHHYKPVSAAIKRLRSQPRV